MKIRFPRRQAPLARGPGLALALATLGAVGFSLVMLSWQYAMDPELRSRFLLDNVAGIALRNQILLSLLIGAGLPILVAVVIRVRRGAPSEPKIRRFADIVAPLCLAFWVPSLFSWQIAQRNTVMYLLVLSLFVLTLRKLLTRSLETLRLRREERGKPAFHLALPGFLYFLVVLLAAAGYATYTAYFTILNHRQIGTMAFDLGIYDNLMYNALHGRFFHSPVLFGPGNRNYIAGHAELAMVLFVPFYAIRPNAETMLVLQSVMLGGAAIPLYLFAARLIPKPGAALLAVSYLFFAPLHGPHFYDFHWLPIAIFFHFWLYYALVTRKNWLAIPMVLVLCAVREDVGVGLALLGAFLFLTGIRTRFGVFLAIFSSLWFVFDKFILMPRMGAWWFENLYSELFAEGRATYASVVGTLLSNPVYALSTFMRGVKLQYGLHMVAPLVFLPLRRLAFILLLIPGAAFTLMTTAYWPTTEISFQYTTHWIPYLFLTAALGLFVMRYEPATDSQRKAALVTLAIAMLSHSYDFGALLQRDSFRGGFGRISFQMSKEGEKRYSDLMSLVNRIPQKASVAATEAVNPHISSRLDAYAFRYDFGPVDYILLSRNEVLGGDSHKFFAEVVSRVPYGLAGKAGEFYLFKRGPVTAASEAALHELGIHSALPRRR